MKSANRKKKKSLTNRIRPGDYPRLSELSDSSLLIYIATGLYRRWLSDRVSEIGEVRRFMQLNSSQKYYCEYFDVRYSKLAFHKLASCDPGVILNVNFCSEDQLIRTHEKQKDNKTFPTSHNTYAGSPNITKFRDSSLFSNNPFSCSIHSDESSSNSQPTNIENTSPHPYVAPNLSQNMDIPQYSQENIPPIATASYRYESQKKLGGWNNVAAQNMVQVLSEKDRKYSLQRDYSQMEPLKIASTALNVDYRDPERHYLVPSNTYCQPHYNLKKDEEDSYLRKNNSLDLASIVSGKDKRTTIMIKNIPNKYTQAMLKEYIDETSKNQYDFLYLRMDFQK